MSSTAHKLNDYQKIKAKEIIADTFLFNGTAHDAIAEIEKQLKITVSYQLIYYYMQQIKKAWLARTNQSIDQIKAKELAKLDKLERQAIIQWEKSKEQATSTTRVENSETRAIITTTKVEDRIGETALLNTLIKLADRRSKLLGLDAPIKQDLSSQQFVKVYANVSPDDWGTVENPTQDQSSDIDNIEE